MQIKTATGPQWLTVPVLRRGHLGPISEVEIDYANDWRTKHVKTVAMNYAASPFVRSALAVMEDVYGERPRTIGDLDIAALERCCRELGLRPLFTRSSATPVAGAKTERLVELLVPRGTTRYVTGLGALNYLDEPLLASHGIAVEVMDYTRTPYPQLHGAFDPHVSILDTIANLGPEAGAALESPALPWAQIGARQVHA